jgi:rhodanese-related sulfurtransferase
MIEVTVEKAAVLIEAGSLLLDVREPEEWEAGHVPGATFIPMASVALRVGELPSDRMIVVMCRSGGRSGEVTEALQESGLDAVNLAGGIHAWAADQLPIVTDTGAPGAVI